MENILTIDKERFLAKKMEESKKKETEAAGKFRVVFTDPKDKIMLETIEQEDEECEKVLVIPRYQVENHNIGIEEEVWKLKRLESWELYESSWEIWKDVWCYWSLRK